MLHQDGTVLVKDLSERFAVTEDCIRKDLAFLENQGFLKRTYGGAMELRSNPHKFHVSDRKSEDIEGKQVIAKRRSPICPEGIRSIWIFPPPTWS